MAVWVAVAGWWVERHVRGADGVGEFGVPRGAGGGDSNLGKNGGHDEGVRYVVTCRDLDDGARASKERVLAGSVGECVAIAEWSEVVVRVHGGLGDLSGLEKHERVAGWFNEDALELTVVDTGQEGVEVGIVEDISGPVASPCGGAADAGSDVGAGIVDGSARRQKEGIGKRVILVFEDVGDVELCRRGTELWSRWGVAGCVRLASRRGWVRLVSLWWRCMRRIACLAACVG